MYDMLQLFETGRGHMALLVRPTDLGTPLGSARAAAVATHKSEQARERGQDRTEGLVWPRGVAKELRIFFSRFLHSLVHHDHQGCGMSRHGGTQGPLTITLCIYPLSLHPPPGSTQNGWPHQATRGHQGFPPRQPHLQWLTSRRMMACVSLLL